MKICVICNFADQRCGISNFGHQTVTALRHAGHDVLAFDGTYPTVYARREAGIDPHLPPDLDTYDVCHVIWHAITLNHYAAVDWASFPTALPRRGPLLSLWDCGPSDAYCPFDGPFKLRWMLYPRDGYEIMDYPVPDWVTDLPEPSSGFVIGGSSVRGDGVDDLRQVCAQYNWELNLPTPGTWRTIEDEIRRLARSTVNVCWYNSGATWKDRASAPSMMIASRRPVLINDDQLLRHLWGEPDIYNGSKEVVDGRIIGLGPALQQVYADWQAERLRMPEASYQRMRWTTAAARMTQVWTEQRALQQGAL